LVADAEQLLAVDVRHHCDVETNVLRIGQRSVGKLERERTIRDLSRNGSVDDLSESIDPIADGSA
jgi:hypothetical protein